VRGTSTRISDRSGARSAPRILKPHDVYRLLAPRTDPDTQETLEYGDRTDHDVVHRYDADGNGMAGSLQGFDFPGDPQDGVALDIEGTLPRHPGLPARAALRPTSTSSTATAPRSSLERQSREHRA